MVCYEVHNRKNVHFIYILRFEKKNKGFQRSLWTELLVTCTTLENLPMPKWQLLTSQSNFCRFVLLEQQPHGPVHCQIHSRFSVKKKHCVRIRGSGTIKKMYNHSVIKTHEIWLC